MAKPRFKSYKPANKNGWNKNQFWVHSISVNQEKELNANDADLFNLKIHREITGFYGSNHRYVKEIDLIREVLFMFQGHETTDFKKEEKYFKYHQTLLLMHLSNSALESLMQQFIGLMNICLGLQEFCKSCLQIPNLTITAFACYIEKIVENFKSEISNLEVIFVTGLQVDSNQRFPLTNTSLVWLQIEIVKLMDVIYSIYRGIKSFRIYSNSENSIKLEQLSSSQLTCMFLSFLYNQISFSTEERMAIVWKEIFIHSFLPMLEQISDILAFGRISDPYDEFFLNLYILI